MNSINIVSIIIYCYKSVIYHILYKVILLRWGIGDAQSPALPSLLNQYLLISTL